ncbi:MAG: selenide, water dikinase SelD, partial [Myxococcales bacterium]|nr:selenide, water dikinase SelD [Myxococcales bacterium]
LRLAVVGGGAAGAELAFCLEARLREAGRDAQLTLFCDSPRLLPGSPARVARFLAREAERRGIEIRCGTPVLGVEEGALQLEGERFESDLVSWATGAAPTSLCVDSPLPRDAQGFVRVRDTLQVEGHDELFATGDCASLADQPWVRKAGVYAVRQGPVLDANLRARLRGKRLRAYRAQRDFLSLLNLGERRALGSKWGLAVSGSGVWRLKDAIDQRFMRRFRVLAAGAGLAPDFPTPEAMGMEVMACGGCAAKLGPTALEQALARLPEAPADGSVRQGVGDDAALLDVGGALQVSSVDAFRAFADDPWLVGRVAAVNAASDVFAKGGQPRHALALVTVPESDPAREEETLHQVLRGVRAALDPQGIALVGGHSTTGDELFVGLSISGELPGESDWLSLEGARPGDRLLLTRPLGSGVLLAADMQGRCPGPWIQSLYGVLQRHNAHAARVARESGAHACTDVSGFGLAGHLGEMLRASGVSAVLDPSRLPAYAGATELLAQGLR